MASLVLDGGTLGEKHRNYNNLFKQAIDNHQTSLEFKLRENDIENLLNIDLASHNKNVDYILSVLKCDDMLCISRALKQSTWLITDDQYAHIINPEYLRTQLLPHMNTKAYIKLKKYVKHNIKNEARAEEFYNDENELKHAVNWLPACSIPFIEKKITSHIDHLKLRTFKRLCEKSITVYETVYKHIPYYNQTKYSQAVMFLLKTNVNKYLDVIQKEQQNYCYTKFNDKATHFIMKNCPQRIMDNLNYYVDSLDIPTFVKYLKVEEVKTFLYTQAKQYHQSQCRNNLSKLFEYETLKYFIKKLPKSEQFEFVNRVFIDKNIAEVPEETLTPGSEVYEMKKLCSVVDTPCYVWYRFATFEQAFENITKLISKDVDNNQKYSMLRVLMSCSKHNLEHIQTLLEYYLDKHKAEEYYYKLQFATELLKRVDIHELDEKTWNTMNELFKILKLYEESKYQPNNKDNEFVCIESIILYNVLKDQEVPEIIQKQFTFRTLKSHKRKLNHQQNNKVFLFLYDLLLNKLNKPIANENDFSEAVKTMDNILGLLHDWEKELQDYPLIIDKIKEFIKIKKENSWKESLLSLYNFKKPWRRLMFEDSIDLHPSEEVCLNALKHEPQLLERHNEQVETLRTDDAVSLQRLLRKLRIYWPESLARCWTDIYLQNLNKVDGHKATVRGLCTTLSQKDLLKIIDEYKPLQPKIDWNTVDDRILSIQRFLSKNMHIARPQPAPHSILLYAQGDYLQFALPSLLAIFYNLSLTQSVQYIPKLLNAPVSLQKHGIRFAFLRLDHNTCKNIFLNCWKASKNASIRAIIFKFTHEILCNEKNPANAASIWELIESFIDNLTFEEDKKVYSLLVSLNKVPLNVRAKYLMKSYNFIKNLIPKVKQDDREYYEGLFRNLAGNSREVIADMCPDFVIALIREFIDSDFFGSKSTFGCLDSSSGVIPVISAFLLCAKNENDQVQNFEKVFVPIMRTAFEKWDEKRDRNYFVRSNFQHLLSCLRQDLRDYVVKNNMIMPVKIFSFIQIELEKTLSSSENYIMLTKWKLTVALVKFVDKFYSEGKEWDIICNEIAPDFGKLCLDYLKEDVKIHFLCIYTFYSKALLRILNSLFSEDTKLVVFESMLSDDEFIQGYLATIQMICETYCYNQDKCKSALEKILSYPSVEVTMHYYSKFSDKREYILG